MVTDVSCDPLCPSQPQQMYAVDSSDGLFCAGVFLLDDGLDTTVNLLDNFNI